MGDDAAIIAVMTEKLANMRLEITRLETRLDKIDSTIKTLAMTIVGIVIAAVIKQAGLGG